MREKWVSLKENLASYNLKQQHTSTEWALKQIGATINCEEYSIISSFAKIAYIIPVSNAWPERSGIKRIKTNKRSTLKNDTLNALLMISLNGPQIGTLEAKKLMKHTARIYGERKQYKKAPSIKQKEQDTQTDSKHTQVTLCVEPEFMENAEEYLDYPRKIINYPRKIHHFKF